MATIRRPVTGEGTLGLADRGSTFLFQGVAGAVDRLELTLTRAEAFSTVRTLSRLFDKTDGRMDAGKFGQAFSLVLPGSPATKVVVRRIDDLAITVDGVTYETKADFLDAVQNRFGGPTAPQRSTLLTVNDDAPTLAGLVSDTITGRVAAMPAESTFNPGDRIDGGANADRLVLTLAGDFAGLGDTGGVRGVETLALNAAGAAARSFNARRIESLQGLEIDASQGAVNVSELVSTTTRVLIANQASGEAWLGFAAAAVAGAQDQLALAISSVGSSSPVRLVSPGIETLALTSTGSNALDLAGVSAAAAITVTGSGSLSLTTVPATLATLDASAYAGALNSTLGSAPLTSVRLGAGNDLVTLSNVSRPVVIDGGGGSNQVLLKGLSGTVQPLLSNVQSVAFDGFDSAATATVDFSRATGIQQLRLVNFDNPADLTVTELLAIRGLTPVNGRLEVVQENGNERRTIIDLATTPLSELVYRATVSPDRVVSDPGVGSTSSYALTAGNAARVTMEIGANVNVGTEADFAFARAGTVTVNVAAGSGVAGLTRFAGTVTADLALSVALNAAGLLDEGATLTAGGAVSATVVAGAAGRMGDQVVLNTPLLRQLSVTSKGDLTLDGAGLSALRQAQLGGADPGASLTLRNTLGSLDSTALPGLSLIATGLAGGLTLDSVMSGSAQRSSILLSGMTGSATLSEVIVAGSLVVQGPAAASLTLQIMQQAGSTGSLEVAGGSQADTISVTLTEGGRAVVSGGAGNDRLEVEGGFADLRGGLGADTFVITSPTDRDAVSTTVTTVIRDYDPMVDNALQLPPAPAQGSFAFGGPGFLSLSDLVEAADMALDGTVRYYLAQVSGGDSYLVTDDDGVGITQLIQLVGVDVNVVATGQTITGP